MESDLIKTVREISQIEKKRRKTEFILIGVILAAVSVITFFISLGRRA